MLAPDEIQDLIHKHNHLPQGVDTTGHECEGAKFHSPRPLRVHSVLLYDNHIAYLCGTCRDNLAVFLQLWDAEGGLSWPIQRLFGNQTRAMAQLVVMAKNRASSGN